jgi:type III pantothenate kinase
MVDGMIERMRQETGDAPCVIATGGLAPVVSKHSRSINTIDQDLTLEGLRIIFEKNKKTYKKEKRRQKSEGGS